MPEGTTQITVRIPADLARRLKAAAAMNGETITGAMERIARSYIRDMDSQQARELAEAIEAAR